MNRSRTLVMAGAVAAALVLPLGPANAGSSQKPLHRGYAVGLVGGDTLVAVDLSKPGKPKAVGKVSGLSGDTELVGIDFRVQDQKLYGVGNAGGVYTLPRRRRPPR